MKKVLIVIVVILSYQLITIASDKGKNNPEQSNFLTIAGSDLQRPYEIIDGLFHVKAVSTCFACKDAFRDGVEEALKEVVELGKKYGGNALINTSIQLVIYANKMPNDDIGQVVIFGTLVKYKN
jgi:uncharacterized protein YbjQ (UPF0145 family)